MINGVNGNGQAGLVTVAVSNGQRTPREWAQLCVQKFVQVSDSAPQPIRDQAHAFRANIERIMENYIDMAINEDRVYRNGPR
jgi:hypothetical protein